MSLSGKYRHLCFQTILAILIFVLNSPKASASNDVATVCFEAGQIAAEQHGIPPNIMRAIALTETGKTIEGAFKPWPWTVNFEGKGLWFENRAEASSVLTRHLAAGVTNFDVGCYQLNFKWHGHHFSSLEEMIDPYANANYAAYFLRSLFDEMNDWTAAAGAYHSRNKLPAEKYLARFKKIFANLDNTPSNYAAQKSKIVRQNNFPLLTGTSNTSRSGSLFPKGQRAARGLIYSVKERG